MKTVTPILLLLLCQLVVLSCSRNTVEDPLSTLPPIGKLNVTQAFTGSVIEIIGENFSKNPVDNIIRVSGVQVSHVEVIEHEDLYTKKIIRKLRTSIPHGATSGEVTLTIGKNTIELGGLVMTVFKSDNQWSPLADFPGKPKVYSKSAIFTINNKAYVGLGHLQDITARETTFNDIWEYNPEANAWTKKSDFPGGNRSNMISFSANNKGYIGLGYVDASSSGTAWEKDLWEYDPTADKWTKKKDFPGGRRADGFYFTIGDRCYFGGGTTVAGLINDFWEYNPSNDSWKQFKNPPEKVTSAPGSCNKISTSSKGYLCANSNELWEYDPVLDKWMQVVIWSGADGIEYEYGFSMNNRIYVGLSYWTRAGFSQDLSYTFMEYDPVTKLTKKLSSFAGAPAAKYRSGIIDAFSINNVGYVGIGFNCKDLWAFKP